MISVAEEDRLKRELLGLFGHMNRMRRELAALQGNDSGGFASMADTLDAIVENTEAASNTILESMEAIEGLVGGLKGGKPGETGAVCNDIQDRINNVFEACSFQDLTGQRITRVVNALKFVEERVGAMVRIWGKEELAQVFEDVQSDSAPSEQGDVPMHGPQRPGVAIQQEDVDRLFSQDDIDKLFG